MTQILTLLDMLKVADMETEFPTDRRNKKAAYTCQGTTPFAGRFHIEKLRRVDKAGKQYDVKEKEKIRIKLNGYPIMIPFLKPDANGLYWLQAFTDYIRPKKIMLDDDDD